MSPSRPLSHPRERTRWGIAAIVLSLDATGPFHDAMEVPVEKAFFVTDLRALIEQGRHEAGADPSVVPPLAERLLAALGEKKGEAAAALYTAWMRDSFTELPSDRPEWGSWESVFAYWASSRKELTVLPNAKRFAAVLDVYRETSQRRALVAELDRARAARAEGWDLEMLARHRAYDDDGLDPFLYVGFTVGRVRFRACVHKLAAMLDAADQERLADAAQQVMQAGLSLSGPRVLLSQLVQGGA